MDKLNSAYDKRVNFLRSTKMILKFRDSTIAKLEGKTKETKEEQIVSTVTSLSFLGRLAMVVTSLGFWTDKTGKQCRPRSDCS